jgi:hypothetical protein
MHLQPKSETITRQKSETIAGPLLHSTVNKQDQFCSPSMNVTKLKKATATTIISRLETSHG